jgi:GNAT superfamily N-acetyltransferase
MGLRHVDGVVALQSLCFPPPFDAELLWKREHLSRHLELFPEGQFVAVFEEQVVGSCSNTVISEEIWCANRSWDETVGGYLLDNFDGRGSTVYGLDISVHPDFRRRGIAKALYQARFDLVKTGYRRYGTACRLPDFIHNHFPTPELFATAVSRCKAEDRTLTPLLKMGLTMTDVLTNYMDDPESGNAAALLEWRP